MRLVPPFQSILSFLSKGKYASLVARQAALSSRLGYMNNREFTTNLALDNPEPATGITLRQIIMSIPSQVFPNTPLFHTVDRLWESDTGVHYGFLPENEADAMSFVTGLIPFLKETASPWFLRFFSEEAKVNHANSKWDPKTRQSISAEEIEIDEFLADDDELNKTDEPTAVRTRKSTQDNIEIHVPKVAARETFPTMYNDTDSVSTFNPATPMTASTSHQPSSVFTPKIVSHALYNSQTSKDLPIPMNVDDHGEVDAEVVSKISDTESRISTMEMQMQDFNTTLKNISKQSRKEAQKNAKTLASILALLKNQNLTSAGDETSTSGQSVPSDTANHLDQTSEAGGSVGTAGSGS